MVFFTYNNLKHFLNGTCTNLKSFVPFCVNKQRVSIRQNGKYLVAIKRTTRNTYNIYNAVIFFKYADTFCRRFNISPSSEIINVLK